MPHFFIKQSDVSENKVLIKDIENYRHIAKSLRARIGENLLLIDDKQIQYETKIINISSNEIICEVQKSYESKRDLDFDLYLAQSPLRSESQITVIEKATELGIRAVYPIITDNCAVKKHVAEGKIDKWQRVMYEASKQCERAKVPVCYPVSTLNDVLSKKFDRVIVFGERSTELSLKTYLRNQPIQKNESVLIVIGPEGGFSEREFEFFRAESFPIITLGNLILKADTAVTVAIGDIVYEYQG